MKAHIWIFLLLNFFYRSALALPLGWKLSRNVNDVKVWHLISNSDVNISLEKRKVRKKIDWKKTKEKEFFKKFEDRKRNVLSYIGISNWKADKYLLTQKENNHQLVVSGTYTDSSNQKISFNEVHIYKESKIIQLLHTRPYSLKNGHNISKKIIDYILKEVVKK